MHAVKHSFRLVGIAGAVILFAISSLDAGIKTVVFPFRGTSISTLDAEILTNKFINSLNYFPEYNATRSDIPLPSDSIVHCNALDPAKFAEVFKTYSKVMIGTVTTSDSSSTLEIVVISNADSSRSCVSFTETVPGDITQILSVAIHNSAMEIVKRPDLKKSTEVLVTVTQKEEPVVEPKNIEKVLVDTVTAEVEPTPDSVVAITIPTPIDSAAEVRDTQTVTTHFYTEERALERKEEIKSEEQYEKEFMDNYFKSLDGDSTGTVAPSIDSSPIEPHTSSNDFQHDTTIVQKITDTDVHEDDDKPESNERRVRFIIGATGNIFINAEARQGGPSVLLGAEFVKKRMVALSFNWGLAFHNAYIFGGGVNYFRTLYTNNSLFIRLGCTLGLWNEYDYEYYRTWNYETQHTEYIYDDNLDIYYFTGGRFRMEKVWNKVSVTFCDATLLTNLMDFKFIIGSGVSLRL